jgi:tRNA(Ile)-lysidine synthase
MNGLLSKAAQTAAEHAMFSPGAPVVVMVSGGADSVSLLRALASGSLGDVSLFVLHVDHVLRAAASDADAAFVESLADELGVPVRVVRVDVAGYASAHDLNLEDAGRVVRYLEAEAEADVRCDAAGLPRDRGRIATAHTFDDRAETMLMRLAQGSGAAGLLSLPYTRGRIVRPLLDCSRADVLAYLGSLGQYWREDASNRDTTRLRARVRSEVMPLLRAINPRFDEALSRTLTVLGDEDELLEGMAEGFAAQFAEVREGEVRVDRSRIRTISRPMMRRVLRRLLFDAFPSASRLEFEHVEALCDGIATDGFARDLPGGLRAFDEYGTLVVSQGREGASPLAPRLLEVPGTIDLGEAGVMTAEPGSVQDPGSDPLTTLVDVDALSGPLEVSSVRPGDRMRPFGMAGSRKLQDILTDAKVPARERPGLPVVRDGERIVWVAGIRSSEEYRVGPSTRRTVRLTWKPPESRKGTIL